MISDIAFAIVAFFIRLLMQPILFLDDASLPPELLDALTNVGQFVAMLNTIFPFGVILVCIGIVIALEFAIFIYKGIMWLIKKVPTIT